MWCFPIPRYRHARRPSSPQPNARPAAIPSPATKATIPASSPVSPKRNSFIVPAHVQFVSTQPPQKHDAHGHIPPIAEDQQYTPPCHETLDNAALPPPPTISHDFSPASNAPAELATAAYEFCRQWGFAAPQTYPPVALGCISQGLLGLRPPPRHFTGAITHPGPSRATIKTHDLGCADTCLLSTLPLYSAAHHRGKERRCYFEVAVKALGRGEKDAEMGAVAMGFAATPYPEFRLPGWNRGSVAVHGDDGRRFCNDSFGGQEFTTVFAPGDVVGIGMLIPASNPHGIKIFFTRNGQDAGGWDLFEERDAENDWPAEEGLDGSCDIFAAVGVWGAAVEADVRFCSDEEIAKRF